MPVNALTRRVLASACCDAGAAKEIADVIDAGSGTLTGRARTMLDLLLADIYAGGQAEASINAGTALSQPILNKLIVGLADAGVAGDIQAILTA